MQIHYPGTRPSKIKSITIEASKKVNTTDDKIKALENKLETLKDISEPSRQQLEELADLENQIHSLYENKTDAARLRAKVDWYEKGEQSTKYFFNLDPLMSLIYFLEPLSCRH
jgi:TolA-binding protein